MTFWRGLSAVASKEFRHFLRDPYTVGLACVVPVCSFLVFGYALETKVRDVLAVVQNLDDGPYGRDLESAIAASPTFQARATPRTTDIQASLRRGECKVAIQIPVGYSNAVFYGRPAEVKIWVDGSDGVLAAQAVLAAQSIALRQLLESTGKDLPVRFSSVTLYNPEGRGAFYFVPALVALFSEMTTLLLVALSMAKESERGTLDQLRITAISLPSLIAGKLLSCSVVGLGVGLILVALMKPVFGLTIAGSAFQLGLALLAFQGPALGLGLILTAEARNQAQALQLTYLVFLPSILLSGMVFPRETMPQPARIAGGFVPATWSIGAIRGLILRGESLNELQTNFLAIAMLTVIFLVAGAWRLQKRLS